MRVRVCICVSGSACANPDLAFGIKLAILATYLWLYFVYCSYYTHHYYGRLKL
jgi:hypothetical protein